MKIALITPSLPTRAGPLSQALQSVAAQNRKPDRHLVEVDHARAGSATVRNRLADAAADCEWLAFLDDDDILFPDHLGSLADAAKVTGAQLVYSFCEVEGRDGWNPSRLFNADALRAGNYIPVTVLVERAAFLAAGGFPLDPVNGWEDWALWLALLDNGCRFACRAHPTWRYRFHPGSKTYAGEEAAR